MPDIMQAGILIEGPQLQGAVGDKGYDADAFVCPMKATGIVAAMLLTT
jgi:hypothetical protein